MLGFARRHPHFVFRPSQALRRVGQKFQAPAKAGEFREAVLPWGLRIRYRPDEHIGEFIHHHGLYDLCVSETLYRLSDPGEIALDVGGNIGQMASILAHRVGRSGHVHVFEPHPEILEELRANVALWRRDPRAAEVTVHPIALSETAGEGKLAMSSSFDDNRGTAALVDADDTQPRQRTHTVKLARLDDTLPADVRVGVMKLDVEGHEFGVLKGATNLLKNGSIRDIMFEDYGAPPTPVMSLLQSFGYRIYSVEQQLLGLRANPTDDHVVETRDSPPNYLATLAPERALARLARRGWGVFGMLKA
ncbi:FkbM family methyltransferase [Phenylobacterium sp.]|uniref:FkbM family methyltransferase n=1 Tax=Phenylobacterium sp. TaxID=1871053 RepID=UPI0025F67CE6|nr:FkbM family methyltransferase [Phenylobacterium sp.]